MPTLICDQEERLPIDDEMPVILPPLPEWKAKYPWLVSSSYKVRRAHYDEAEELSNKLFGFYQKSEKFSDEEIENIIERLRGFKLPSAEEKDNPAFWNRVALKMPNLAGPNGDELRQILSNLCSGLILEAMCGYESYLYEKPNYSVIALDFAAEALKRYPYPQRTRVLFDLNNGDFNEFSENCFDYITICFGFKYLLDVKKVCDGFIKILKPGGSIIFIENPTREYSQATHRPFSSKICEEFLSLAGFRNIYSRQLFTQDYDGSRDYFLVSGKK